MSGPVTDTQPMPGHKSTPGVPGRYRGVWVRTLLETPELQDTTTVVRWLQTSAWHADLRIPAARPRVPADPHGFCGITQVDTLSDAEQCQWHRRTDVQPPGPLADAGWMVFEGPHRVIETGVHGPYREVWERLPDSVGRCVALAGLDRDGTDDGMRWLVAGAYMMRVRPRRAAWPADTRRGDTLASVVARHPAMAVPLFDFEISFGRLDAGVWAIEHSTAPALEGRRVPCALRRLDGARAQVEMAGESADAPMAAARVIEWDVDIDAERLN